MRILITNHALANRAGSELYVRDLAVALLKNGHAPIVYSTRLGQVADEIRAQTVPVVDNLANIATPPDIIHGHHHLETISALLHFPGVPAIFVCHGWTPWEERPPRFPRILRYVAVDNTCRDRLACERGIPEERIRVLLNFVDLDRFNARGPLPSKPERALALMNNPDDTGVIKVLRKSCSQKGIKLDVAGWVTGTVCDRPESVLPNYDVVFAKGRAALEALAVGAAVVACDVTGAGEMVTTRNVEQLRLLNFGIRHIRRPVSPSVISEELAKYDPDDAGRVSEIVRASAGRDLVLSEYLSLYQETIDEYSERPNHDGPAELRAASEYLRELTPEFRKLLQKAGQWDGVAGQFSWRMLSKFSALKKKLGLSRRKNLP